MTHELIRYTEPLNEGEITFLEKKESKERKQYYKVFRLLMLLCFIFPFATAWYRAYDGAPNAFSQVKFFVSAGILLSISCCSTYLTYRVNLRRVQLDLRQRTKTIEINHITRKVHIAAKNTYYLYTNSLIKLSIEVSYDDYDRLKEGDEVCIEYTTNAKLYLGYF